MYRNPSFPPPLFVLRIVIRKECLLSVQMGNVTKEEFVQVLRRQSTGFPRGSSKFRGVTLHKCGRWEARMGQFLGKKYASSPSFYRIASCLYLVLLIVCYFIAMQSNSGCGMFVLVKTILLYVFPPRYVYLGLYETEIEAARYLKFLSLQIVYSRKSS